jgi:hypothetical protein
MALKNSQNGNGLGGNLGQRIAKRWQVDLA